MEGAEVMEVEIGNDGEDELDDPTTISVTESQT